MLGRFELRKPLGQGAQSTVWLAFDPRMEREVAIKVLHSVPGDDERSVAQWLQEARSVGRVKHPSIVPVYEADIQDQYAYLVFEYVDGKTLGQVLAQRGALPAQEAVALMMDIIDAIAVAHLEGIVHRDIKPSNILVDSAGRARLMDFGVATRVNTLSQGGNGLIGTLGYMAPEVLSGAEPAPSMDLFSCGVVLAEMLSGHPLITDADPARVVYRMAHEQLALPASLPQVLDDQLRALVNRALARDPAQRFTDARALFTALDAWSRPADAAQDGAAGGGGGGGGTLEFLLRRMRHKSDFPALSESVVRIQSMVSSERESVSSVTNEILKDVALTNKLLRVVNSAHYARGGSISTVSRAVNLVGFNGIRNMALSLVLLEHMQDKSHAAQLKDEFVRALLAGTIGGELCPGVKESEEAFIGAMFQNLGRLLVQFYFPEEAQQIRKLVEAREPISESVASVRVLGLGFEDLGLGVSKSWGLPVSMQRCMRKPAGPPPSSAHPDQAERMRWVAQAANEIADVMLQFDGPEAVTRVDQVTRKFAQSIGSSSKDMQAATERARQKLVEMATAMEIRVLPGSAAAKVLHAAAPNTLGSTGQPTSGTGTGGDSHLMNFALHATQTADSAAPQGASSKQVAETLAAGIQDITNAMVEDFKLSDILRMILEAMFRAMSFDRIIFCMRDPKTETITGRFGLGHGVEAFTKEFKVPLKAATPDLFGVVCLKGADTMISDASESRILQRLPEWYRRTLNAPTFLLLPLQIKGAPFGLIYADKTHKGALELDEKELALLRTLRNQAVMAFKQSS
jgi:serine/threonine protein kinase